MTRSGVRAVLLFVAGAGVMLLSAAQANAQSEETGDVSSSNSQKVIIEGSGSESVTVTNSSTSTATSSDQAAVSIETQSSVHLGSLPDGATTGEAGSDQPQAESTDTPLTTLEDSESAVSVTGSDSSSEPASTPVINRTLSQKGPASYSVQFATPTSQPAASAEGQPAPQSPATSDGLERYTSWLNQSLLPTNFEGYAPLNRTLPAGSAIALLFIAIGSLTLAFGGYVAQLRRSGFSHGARSDADGVFTFATPTKVGLVWAISPAPSPLSFGGLTNIKRGGECI